MNAERFEELYERFCDATLSGSDLEQFKAALSDPAFARKFVELSKFKALIYDELRLAQEADEAQEVASRPVSGVRNSISTGKTTRARAVVSGRQHTRRVVKPQRSYWGWGLAAMIGLMAVAGYMKFVAMQQFGNSDPEIAVLESATDATLQRGRDKTPAANGTALKAGDVLSVGPKGVLAFKYPDGTLVELGAESELKLITRGEGKRLVLKHGALDANVAKQPLDSPLTIATAQSEATVLGTELNLQASELTTRLAVKTGNVKLQRAEDGQSVQVPAGNYVLSAKGNPLTAKALPAASQTIEDFEGDALKHWSHFVGSPNVSKSSLKSTAGKFGQAAMEINASVAQGDGGGAYRIVSPQDWSGYDGVKFWVRGQRSMRMLNIEVFDNAPVINPQKDNWERFVYEFTDDFDGWREMVVPFRLFKRRSYQTVGAPNDGFTLTQIHGFGFMASNGQAVFAVDQLELYRK